MGKGWYASSYGRVELELTLDQARTGYHQGQCDMSIANLMLDPEVATQLAALDPEDVKRELYDYGAWDDTELADTEQNKARILWLACADVCEQAERNEWDE